MLHIVSRILLVDWDLDDDDDDDDDDDALWMIINDPESNVKSFEYTWEEEDICVFLKGERLKQP